MTPRSTRPDPDLHATCIRVLEVLSEGPDDLRYALPAKDIARQAFPRGEWRDLHVHSAIRWLVEAGLVAKSTESGRYFIAPAGKATLYFCRLVAA